VAAKLDAAHRFALAHPGSAHAWGIFGMTLDAHGFPEPAVVCYRRAAELDPDDLRWPYYRALALTAAGSPGVLDAFEQALALTPGYGPLLVRFADALAAAGETDRAAELYRRAAGPAPPTAPAATGSEPAPPSALSAPPSSEPPPPPSSAAPDSGAPPPADRSPDEAPSAAAPGADPAALVVSWARLGLARLAAAGGDLDGAVAEARTAVAAAPRHGAAHALLAELLRRAGDADGAARERRAAARLPVDLPLPDPVYAAVGAEGVSSFWGRRRGRAYLERGEPERAAHELEQALAAAPAGPGRAEIHDELGLALGLLGRHAEAAEHHRAALSLRPGFAAAATHLGEALAAGGDPDGAVAALERALAIDPHSIAGAAAALDLGTLHQRAGRRAEAAAAFRRALNADPDDPRPAARLAWLLATAPEPELRDGAEAVRLAGGAVDATGGRLPEALDVLAAAYAEAGRFAEAVTTARRARDLAGAAGAGALATAIAARLALYENSEPYRDGSR
jgi:tetratricopeptide (TPR) repeat protein